MCFGYKKSSWFEIFQVGGKWVPWLTCANWKKAELGKKTSNDDIAGNGSFKWF